MGSIESSVNQIPWSIIQNKPDSKGNTRCRPVFDCRQINEDCELIHTFYPNMPQFDDHYGIPGLFKKLFT